MFRGGLNYERFIQDKHRGTVFLYKSHDWHTVLDVYFIEFMKKRKIELKILKKCFSYVMKILDFFFRNSVYNIIWPVNYQSLVDRLNQSLTPITSCPFFIKSCTTVHVFSLRRWESVFLDRNRELSIITVNLFPLSPHFNHFDPNPFTHLYYSKHIEWPKPLREYSVSVPLFEIRILSVL